MFCIIYMIYIMILNLPANEISLLSMSIQRQLLKNFILQHQEMNIYKIRFQKINETWLHCYMTCFLHISATSSCVASTSHVEIASVSSSSSPGKLLCQSKHDIIYCLVLFVLNTAKRNLWWAQANIRVVIHSLNILSYVYDIKLDISVCSNIMLHIILIISGSALCSTVISTVMSSTVSPSSTKTTGNSLTFMTMIHISCTVCMLNLIVSNNIYYDNDICSWEVHIVYIICMDRHGSHEIFCSHFMTIYSYLL